jgi:hypothetical protein
MRSDGQQKLGSQRVSAWLRELARAFQARGIEHKWIDPDAVPYYQAGGGFHSDTSDPLVPEIRVTFVPPSLWQNRYLPRPWINTPDAEIYPGRCPVDQN